MSIFCLQIASGRCGDAKRERLDVTTIIVMKDGRHYKDRRSGPEDGPVSSDARITGHEWHNMLSEENVQAVYCQVVLVP
jgi:hypothetical protein